MVQSRIRNQHLTAINNDSKTNNVIEALHNRFQIMVGKYHPSLYTLLMELKKEQEDVQQMITEVDAGRRI